MRNAMPCVGLIVLAGSLTVLVTPDDEGAAEPAPVFPMEVLPTVVIDAGHGGRDEGARNGWLIEKHLTLDVALRLEKVLQEIGFPTLLTRRDDRYLRLSERTAIGNQVANSLFLSVHFNHARGTTSTGIETFFASEKLEEEAAWSWTGIFNPPRPVPRDSGEILAGCIQTALIRHTEGENRGIRGPPYYVARHTRAPAVLVECGFINNPMEARLIGHGGYRDLLARSIAEGVASFHKSRPRLPAGTEPALQSTPRSSRDRCADWSRGR